MSGGVLLSTLRFRLSYFRNEASSIFLRVALMRIFLAVWAIPYRAYPHTRSLEIQIPYSSANWGDPN